MMTGSRVSCARMSDRISIPLRPGKVRSSNTRSNGRSAICDSPSSPLTAVSTSKPSISSRVWRDSRISDSSSTMSTVPAGDGLPLTAPRVMTAASDMDCLPAQWKIERERRARSWIAFHANFARMLLDDAVRDRKSQPGAAVLPLGRRRLRREKWIVNALYVFRRDARAGIGNSHAHHVAVAGGHLQLTTARHRVFGVEKQVQKHLLQSSGISLNRGNLGRQVRLNLNLRRLELVL